MISILVKQQIEARYGHPVRKPEDCFELAVHIITLTNHSITGKRLEAILGFTDSHERISTEEYDTIAKYIGYADWMHLADEMKLDHPRDNHYYVEKKLWRNKYILNQFLSTWGILVLGGLILAAWLIFR